jgi:thiol-disulfide isomerase/thioredoxin
VSPGTLLLALALAAASPASKTSPASPASPPPPSLEISRAQIARADSLIAVETRVHWTRTNPESALAQARRDGMPVFLDFYATWCAPCHWMDRVVYSDPLLSEVAQGVVMLRVDIDQADGQALARRFDVTAYPTLIHISPEGKEAVRWVGPLNLRDTRLNLGQAAVPAERRADVEAQVAKGPADAIKQSSAVLFYGCRGEVENARAVVTRYEKATIGSPAKDRAPVYLSLGKAEEFAGHDDRAIDAYGRVLSIDPDGLWAWRAWLGMSTCLEHQGKPLDAIVAAQQAATRGPRLPFLEARVARLEMRLPRPTAPPGVDDGPN